MKKINKITNGYKYLEKIINPFSKIGVKWINKINYAEFIKPIFNKFNERPVEYRFVFEQISKYYPETILDVGTGLTALPHLMANCGIKVTAIDNIKDYWPKGMFNRHFYVINDDITDSKLEKKFDMITCISTLEHINKYDESVHNMANLLNARGYIILSFPYNEKSGVENVYEVSNSNITKLPSYKTSVYSRSNLDKWVRDNNLEILDQEYWQFFSGDYWTVGEKLALPKKVSSTDKHQISCVLFQKKF